MRNLATRIVPAEVAGVDAAAMRLCMTLRTASNMVFYDLREHLSGHTDLNGAMLNVLLMAHLNEEIELRRIIKFANLKKATASALVDSMVKQELLSRRTSPDDRRVLLLSLTTKGRELFADAFREYNAREQRWAALLTEDERETLITILMNMVNRGIESGD
ncbi:MarR family winged helix-turn-helix transcriptional regulator [Leucobacter sp. HY1910]